MKFSIFCLFLIMSVSPANSQEIMPWTEVKKGDTGYGLTVFEGTKPEKFSFKVVDILQQSSAPYGRSPQFILLLSGGPIGNGNKPVIDDARVIGGMSGSPLFIGDKIIGAVASTTLFSQQAFAFATPLELTINFNPSLNLIMNPFVFENEEISANLKRLPSLINAGETYVTCNVWGDISSCYGGTVTFVHPDNPTLFFALGHSNGRTGQRNLPFWKGRVLSVLPSLAMSNKIIEKTGQPLGSVVFNGPFGQVGRVGVAPASIPTKIVVENYLSHKWEKNIFIAYAENFGSTLASLITSHNELSGRIIDFEIETRIDIKNTPQIYSKGRLRETTTAGLVAEKFSGQPSAGPNIERINVLLKARPKYEVINLLGVKGNSKFKDDKLSVEVVISGLSGKDKWEKTEYFDVDKKYAGKKIIVADGEWLSEKIIEIFPAGEKAAALLNQVSDRNAIYVFHASQTSEKPKDEGAIFLIMADVLLKNVDSEKNNRPTSKQGVATVDKPGHKWQMADDKDVTIFTKITLPSENSVAVGNSEFLLVSNPEEKPKKKKNFWLF